MRKGKMKKAFGQGLAVIAIAVGIIILIGIFGVTKNVGKSIEGTQNNATNAITQGIEDLKK